MAALWSTQAVSQLKSTQDVSPTRQAAYAWIWAQQAVSGCGGAVSWNTPSGKAVSRNQALKLLVQDGHKRSAAQSALKDRGALPFVQLDRWMVSAGFKPNAQNAGPLLCRFASKVAGSAHPVGRFLKR